MDHLDLMILNDPLWQSTCIDSVSKIREQCGECSAYTEFKKSLKAKWLVLCLCLFVYTASVVYCRDHELSCIREIGSAPPLVGTGVLMCLRMAVPEHGTSIYSMI